MPAPLVSRNAEGEIKQQLPQSCLAPATLARDGRRFSKRVDYSRGMPECPMSPDALRSKFFSLSGAAVGQDAAEAVFTRLQTALDLPDMGELARALGALPMPAAQA